MSDELTHLDEHGHARMVDVADKSPTRRAAVARAVVGMAENAFALLAAGKVQKGDVLAAARIAGIMAAKRTPELVPLCHVVQLTKVELSFELDASARVVVISARAEALDRTGVEMEAMTAASVAALTIYDMLKAVDRRIVIERVALYEKSGGKSGAFVREPLDD